MRKAALKPFQKFKMLQKHLMPRFIVRFQHFNITSKLLSDVDRKIRHFVRKTLHLFEHSSNAIFYAPLKEGGLGIFNFKLMIPIIMKRRMEKVANSSPKLERVLLDATSLVESINNLIKTPLMSNNAVKQHFSRELDTGYSGNGISQVKNGRSSHSFLVNPPRDPSGLRERPTPS